jgi:hypothetical protein
MSKTGLKQEPEKGCDATHRAASGEVHLTHGCIQLFCGFDEMLIASRSAFRQANGAFVPLCAMANSISPGAPR